MLLNKSDVIDIVWQFSRYHGNQLIFLENIKSENAIAALIYLTNILENSLKAFKDDYDCNFVDAIDFAFKQDVLTQIENEFLNDKTNGIRKLRNYFAHANLSKFNFKLANSEMLYPFTENCNCELFYDLISDVVFNIICKIAIKSLIIEKDINTDDMILKTKYSIVLYTPEQILEDKGINPDTLSSWHELTEADRYRYAENTSNVKFLSYLFSQINN